MPTKRTSAYLKATQEAQQKQPTVTPESSTTVSQLYGDTATPLHSDTAIPHNSKVAKKEEKITFYLTSGQADKLDDLAYEHKKRTGKRINRNDIVHYLIDQCTSEAINTIAKRLPFSEEPLSRTNETLPLCSTHIPLGCNGRSGSTVSCCKK